MRSVPDASYARVDRTASLAVRAVLAIALLAVALGVAARFDRLGERLFWQDEMYAMLRISGHVQADMDALFDGRVHSRAQVLAIERVSPQRGLAATAASLREEPQRGPLFYLAERAWAGVAGDGVVAVRLLAALIGAAAVGAAFLCGRRLAGGAAGGAILAALVALAPVQLRYSQQAREYSLVTLAVLLAAWLLLRALERPSPARWTAYGGALTLGLYASPLVATLALAHAVVAALAAWRGDAALRGDARADLVAAPHAGMLAAALASRRAVVLGFAAAAAGAATLALAWYASAPHVRHPDELGWLRGPYALNAYALKWAFNLGASFFDTEYASVRLGVVLAPVLATIVAAVAFAIVRRGALAERGVALATLLATLAPVVAYDVLHRAHAEAVTRYQMATWTGVEMLVTMLLAACLRAGGRRAIAGAAGFTLLACISAASLAADRGYGVWWDDNEHLDERLVGRAVAAGRAPALVVATDDGSAGPYAIVLARYLPAGASMLLGTAPLAPPAWPGDVWLFVPSTTERAAVAARVRPATLANVSLPLGLAVPDLRASGEGDATTIAATNALWAVEPPRRWSEATTRRLDGPSS